MYTSYDEHQFYPTPEHVVEKMRFKTGQYTRR